MIVYKTVCDEERNKVSLRSAEFVFPVIYHEWSAAPISGVVNAVSHEAATALNVALHGKPMENVWWNFSKCIFQTVVINNHDNLGATAVEAENSDGTLKKRRFSKLLAISNFD